VDKGKISVKIKTTFISLISLSILLVACSQSVNKDPITSDANYTNHQIRLYSSANYNSYKTSDVISAEIWNISGQMIKFPNNYNIQIFEKVDNGWKEIAEKPTIRLPEGDFTFNPLDGSSYIQMIGVFPNLPDLDQKYKLRIYVSGLMKENDEEIEVVAFTDVTLIP
jgi:hypothetical protein